MKCKQIKARFADFLTGDIDQKSKEEIQEHLTACSSCREDLETLSEIWTKLGVLPEEEPSDRLRPRFYAMLEAYKQGLEQEKRAPRSSKIFNSWLESWWPRRPVFQFTFALILLVVGLALGYFFTSGDQSRTEVAQLRQEIQGIRQSLAVSLLDQPSAVDRLRGVSWSSRLEQPDEETLQTLLNTLNRDSNINVRLAAADALYLFYDQPVVRQGIIQSLSKQTSPLIQVALIDLIIQMRERRAIESLKQLIEENTLNPDVKQRAEEGIQLLSY
jgi:HEAT repeat protein